MEVLRDDNVQQGCGLLLRLRNNDYDGSALAMLLAV
jgi:hypothetical protein